MKLMLSLVICIYICIPVLYTLTAELEKRAQARAMRCYQRLLNISYKDHITEEVCKKSQAAIREYDELLTLVKKGNLGGLTKTILQSKLKEKKERGRQKKRCEELKNGQE